MQLIRRPFKFLATATAVLVLSSAAIADQKSRADSHAPIGVTGDHVHKSGEWMFSFRQMQMSMSGNLSGSDSISDNAIATGVSNRFFGMPGMPPTLRIVPQEMQTDMQMLGLMFAPSDRITLMLMANRIEKDMTLRTYMGGMGTVVRGDFSTSSQGWGDTKFGALISLVNGEHHKLHINAVLSLPTGSIDEEGQILTPMGMQPTVTLPYAMQLGSGTYDLEPGMTYSGFADRLSWGSQAKLVLRQGENDRDYTLGDQQELSAWGQYLFVPQLSASLRLQYRSSDEIDGMDSEIMGPVQTADPSNYGGDYLNLGFGLTLYGTEGFWKGHRLAFEYLQPQQQDANGVQMEMDSMWTLAYQYAF